MNFDNLPQKNQYKFTEVTSLTGVKPYVLRFWESEFGQINPLIDESGQKLYSTSDLENIKRIKELLFTDKLSIPKAKAMLEEELNLAQINAKSAEKEIKVADSIPTSVSQEVYSGVEMREAIGSIIMQYSDDSTEGTLEASKESLRRDIAAQKEQILQKQFNDEDVVRLVRTKKKLGSVLTKLNTIIEEHNWS